MASLQNTTKPSGLNQDQHEALVGWLMAMPVIVLLLTFLIVPFFMAFGMSFTNQRLISGNPTEFVGLRNFQDLLTVQLLTLDPLVDETSGELLRDEIGKLTYPKLRDYTRNEETYPQYFRLQEWFSFQRNNSITYVLASDVVFMIALFNTFFFVVVIAPVQGGLALLLAMMLNQKLPGINVFRTIYFMPVVVSMVVVALLWRFIYDGSNGVLNTLLATLTFGGFKPVDWLANPQTAMPALMAMSVWQAVGFHMVIWLAGLQTIPTLLYEAANVEGADWWQKFRFVTWPGLRNTAVFVLIIITMQAFGLFTQVDIMTRGGPVDTTQSIVYQMVQRGYGKYDISGGSTISVVLFFIVLAISLLQRYLTREKN